MCNKKYWLIWEAIGDQKWQYGYKLLYYISNIKFMIDIINSIVIAIILEFSQEKWGNTSEICT